VDLRPASNVAVPLPKGTQRTIVACRRLLQVVTDYKRLSAVQGAGRAGRRRASAPLYTGVGKDCSRAGVTIRPAGPSLLLDRTLSAVLFCVFAARTTP
jgi:hypothetical protein